MSLVARGWCCVLLAVFLLAGRAVAQDKIWSALVLATGEASPGKPERELEPFVAGLREVFGYNTYYLLGDKRKRIGAGTAEWIVPTKKFFLQMRCTGRDATAYEVVLELYVEKKLIVTSEVRLARGAPLFIRGPQWGRGQLIFILEVQ